MVQFLGRLQVVNDVRSVCKLVCIFARDCAY